MRVPKFDDPELTKFLTEFTRDYDRTIRNKLDSVTANRAVLLYSPSKKVYEITVDDSGVIHSTKVAG